MYISLWKPQNTSKNWCWTCKMSGTSLKMLSIPRKMPATLCKMLAAPRVMLVATHFMFANDQRVVMVKWMIDWPLLPPPQLWHLSQWFFCYFFNPSHVHFTIPKSRNLVDNPLERLENMKINSILLKRINELIKCS